jgi:hypothetical protein
VRLIDAQDCPFCGGAAYLTFTNPGDPVIMAAGRNTIPAAGRVGPAVLGELLDPTLETIFASDSAGFSTGPVRGVVVNAATHAIVDQLGASASGSIFSVSASDPGGAPPRQSAGAAIALSGRRQEVAFFGEVDASGQMLQQVRTFDFDLQRSVTKPILGETKFSDIAAVTYVAQDDSYYFLDRTRREGKEMMALLKLPRGLTLHKMGEWRRGHRLEHFALTSGTEGSLVVSAWSEKRHTICVLANDAERIRLRDVHSGKGALLVPAYQNLDGLSYLRDTKSGPAPALESIGHRGADDGDDDNDDHRVGECF